MTTDEPGATVEIEIGDSTFAVGGEVEIEGRTFVLGAVYASHRKVAAWRVPSREEAPRRLLAHDPAFPWLGGRVTATRLEGPPARRREKRLDMSGRAWAAWVKEETDRCGIMEQIDLGMFVHL